MAKISKSPQRNTFQKQKYLERQASKGLAPDNDKDTKEMSEYYDSWESQKLEKESDLSWQQYNMEYDLRTCDWILEKVRQDDVYAQNLYAALCNNEFQKLDVVPILSDKKWSCSWRYAGGIIADMREEGDYIDWYCSGIKYNDTLFDDELASMTVEQQEAYKISIRYVSESVVTEEVKQDLYRLGWIVITDEADS